MEKGSERGLIYQHPLSKTDKPVVVVEGATDTLAAMDMGYTAVGRPSADSGGKWLQGLLRGRDVIIVGENDDAGRKGMEKMFLLLKGVCASVKKVLPPAKHKDLRHWHPSTAEFELWLEQEADESSSNRAIEEVNHFDLAAQWINENHTKSQHRLFHSYHNDWYVRDGTVYQPLEESLLDRQLYKYFNAFNIVQQSGKDVKCHALNPDMWFINKLKHALRAHTCVYPPAGVFEPFRIGSGEQIDVAQAIVFRNGLLNVEGGLLKPLSPDIFLTSTLPFDYNPNARCPLWTGTVYSYFNGDQECHDLLQEWFGYNMTASNHMQQMLFLFGVPGSGKSTTLDVLAALLGEARVASLNITDLTTRFGLAPLVGKYAAIITEDRASNRIEADRVFQKLKKITGSDTVSIDRKYREPIQVKLATRFTYAGNELPIFHDEPQAMLQRFNLLYYGNNFYETEEGPDRDLGKRLKRELPGIANWAIIGLKRLLERGEFTQPGASEEHLADFHELSSPLSAMVSTCCVVGDHPEYLESISVLEDLHRAVYESQGIKPMGSALFRSRLKTVLPHLQRRRLKVSGEVEPCYQGIKITDAAKRKFLGRP
jgi:putative DNA primase/helicase